MRPIARAASHPALLVALMASVVSIATRAAAQDDGMHRSPHTESSEILVGAKAMALVEWIDREVEDALRPGGGGGGYVEVSIVPGWLELELGVVAVRSEDETFVTFEPLAKKNLHLDERVDLYVGLGPVLGVAITPEATEVVVGGICTIGSYFWVAEWIGIDLDLTAQLSVAGDPAFEVALGLGPVLRLG